MSDNHNSPGLRTPDAWGLTLGEAKVFGALMDSDTAPRASIASAAGVGEPSVDVLMHRIRRKVSRHGVEIETVTGKGWRLLGRETWRHALAAINGVK